MKRLIVIFLTCFLLQGCSFVKALVAPFKSTENTIPQETTISKNQTKCQGEYKLDNDGNIIYCSKGYYNYDIDTSEKERNLTLKEKIIQYFNKLVGWSFWIVIALVIFFPSLIGFFVGKLFEGVYGIGTKAFKQVSTAIQKVKDTTPSLIDALEKSTDSDVRAWIDEFKKKNNIK